MDEAAPVPGDEGQRAVKRAADPAQAALIRREAELLEVGRHPGVVELVGTAERAGLPALVTVRIAGPTLAEAPALSVEEAAGVLAGVASTLADLHHMGVVHGAVAPEHVLLAPDGRPVLCGFGHGGRIGQTPLAPAPVPEGFADPAREPTDPLLPSADVFGFGTLMAQLVQAAAGDAGRARLRLRALSARAMAPEPARRPPAGDLAAAITAAVPGSRLPVGTGRSAAPGGRRPAAVEAAAGGRRKGAAGAVVVGVGLLATALVAARLTGAPGDTAARPGPRPTEETTAPAASDDVSPTRPGPAPSLGTRPGVGEGCAPVDGLLSADTDGDGCPEALRYADGVVEGAGVRWAVGQPGDHVATGDWACLGASSLAVLRPGTGEVFVFDGWAGPGRDLTAGRAGQVEGAFALRTADLDGDGCPELVVERQGGPPMTIALPMAGR